MVKLNEDKEAKKREIIQKVQSRCVHRRQGIISQEGHNVTHCLDCGKIFYDKEI